MKEYVITAFVTVFALLLTALGVVMIMGFFFWLDDRITFGPSEKKKSKRGKDN